MNTLKTAGDEDEVIERVLVYYGNLSEGFFSIGLQ